MKLTKDGRELLNGECHYFCSSPNTTTMIIKDVMVEACNTCKENNTFIKIFDKNIKGRDRFEGLAGDGRTI